MKIRIISPSDQGTNHPKWWGDYWVKDDLQKEFKRRGYQIVEKDADLDFLLFGRIRELTAPRKFIWLYSHPASVYNESWKKFIKEFEHVFVLSKQFLSIVQKDFKNCSVLLGASSKQFTPRLVKPPYDIIFIGNTGKKLRIEILKYLIGLNKYKIGLAGTLWDDKLGGLIDKVKWFGPYVDNSKLGEIFNLGHLSFYVSHEDMRQNGFVAVRVLDAFRSSECLMIADNNPGLKDIFRNVPIFTSKEDLEIKIDSFLKYPLQIKNLVVECRKDVLNFTFGKVVDEIEKFI